MNKEYKPNIVLDFDGVLNQYTGWKGENYLYKPRPGTKEFLEQLQQEYTIIILSARSPTSILSWLEQYELDQYIHQVTNKKPPAQVYLDDRGLKFEGDYQETLEQIRTFKTHWELEKEEKKKDKQKQAIKQPIRAIHLTDEIPQKEVKQLLNKMRTKPTLNCPDAIPLECGTIVTVAIFECYPLCAATVQVIHQDEIVFEVSSAKPFITIPYNVRNEVVPYTVKTDDSLLRIRFAVIEAIEEETVNGSSGIRGIKLRVLREEYEQMIMDEEYECITAGLDGVIWISTPKREAHYSENEKEVQFFM